MSRRKKLKAQYTPLSIIDKIIYLMLALSIFAVMFLVLFGLGDYLPRLYAENQGNNIACYNFNISINDIYMYYNAFLLDKPL